MTLLKNIGRNQNLLHNREHSPTLQRQEETKACSSVKFQPNTHLEVAQIVLVFFYAAGGSVAGPLYKI